MSGFAKQFLPNNKGEFSCVCCPAVLYSLGLHTNGKVLGIIPA